MTELLAELEAWGDARGWAGTDPYDALNATRLRLLQRSRRSRQLLTQLVKRSPLDLRPVLGIPPARSAAALAQVASAYALGDWPREKLDRVVDLLLDERVPTFAEAAWGYHFDVQTRVFFYPRGAPNTIATAFSGFALVDAFERTGDEALLDVAESAGDFFLRHVPQTRDEPGAYFGYLVGDRTPIHNASMLVAALLARVAAHRNQRLDMKEAAQAAVEFTVARQRPDGSWPYGERPGLEWIDNFHTGYVIEALVTCRNAGLDVNADAVDAAVRFYRDRLFLDDGTPKYLPDSLYPIDIQCVAQGIQTFSRVDMVDFAHRIATFAETRMRNRPVFLFQRRRFMRNATPHIRWTAAPMFLALTYLDRADA